MGEVCTVDDGSIARAAQIIKDGGVIVIPTDTVYGIACDPFNSKAIDRIYELKRRPRYKALQVIMADADNVEDLGLYLPAPLNLSLIHI